MKQKPLQKSIALFLISLVLTLPLYSAQALAINVNIVKNSGQANIEDYLDARGDIWTLEAVFTDLNGATISLENTEISVAGQKDEFETCSSSETGYSCQYLSDLSAGVAEGTYEVQVKHLPSGASDAASLTTDGSAPLITITKLEQRGSEVLFDFTVTDQPTLGTGLAKIEILDADSGAVLQSIETFTEAQRTFRYADISEGKLQAPEFLTGEGQKLVRVRATDRLSHLATSNTRSFPSDFMQPDVREESLRFPNLGDFLGPYRLSTRMEVNLSESSSLLDPAAKVLASSDQLHFINPQASCSLVPGSGDIWHCLWENVEVEPSTSLSVKITATDKFGNVKEETLSKSFTQDVSPPSVDFFGTKRIYGDEKYAKSGENFVELRIAETGALMAKEGLRANLGALGGGNDVEPEACAQIGTFFVCNWTISGAALDGQDTARIGLTHFQDKVGNRGELISSEMMVDTSPPNIEEFEVFGLNNGRQKEYYQSGDQLLFKLNITEKESGLLFMVDLHNLVSDAELKYPGGEFHEPGWELFTEEACVPTQNEGTGVRYWDCTFTTAEPLKSGYQSSAFLRVILEDTPGNREETWPEEKFARMNRADDGKRAKYSFIKLGVVDEAPDYWELLRGGVAPTAGEEAFIDLDTTPYASTRMAFGITLRSDDPQVYLREVQLLGCQSDFPEPGRQTVWNKVFLQPKSSPAKFNLMLEFPPFDAKQYFGSTLEGLKQSGGLFKAAYINHTCTFQFFSQLGNKALAQAEVQEITVQVPFAFSSLGAADAALSTEIERLKEDLRTGAGWRTIEILNDILRILKYLAAVGQAVLDVIEAAGIAEIAFAAANRPLVFDPTKNVRQIAFCLGTNWGQYIAGATIEWIQVPLEVLSCTNVKCPGGQCDFGVLEALVGDWYGAFIDFVLSYYNAALEGAAEFLGAEGGDIQDIAGLFHPAESNYDNIYLSVGTLCVPGIINNLDKWRQIECRYISCLEQDVAQGFATTAACGELKDYLQCKYFFGPLVQLIPGVGMVKGILSAVEGLITDPIALVSSAIILGCAAPCIYADAGGAELSQGCVKAHFFIKLVSIAEKMWGTADKVLSEIEAGRSLDYCGQVLAEPEEQTLEPAEGEAPAEESAGGQTSGVQTELG